MSRAWYTDYADTHYLTILKVDVIDSGNINIFGSIGLLSVPHLWLIPPNEHAVDGGNGYEVLLERHLEYRLPKNVNDKEAMALDLARFLADELQRSILIRDENASLKFLKSFGFTLAGILVIKKKGPKLITSTRKKTMAGLFCIGLILLSVGGYQFAIQMGVPFLARNDKGELIYISGGSHYQFGIEIAMMAGMYSSLAASLLSLIYLGKYEIGNGATEEGARGFIKNERVKVGLILINTVCIYLLYSCLTSIILRKDHGYPYGFTKLF